MTRDVFLFLSAFLASVVEMVEALTIVLAVGVTRGWRSTLVGVGAALLALAALVGLLGPSISKVPIGTLRVIVGALLLVFGLQWLRKAGPGGGGHKECSAGGAGGACGRAATRSCRTRRRPTPSSARRPSAPGATSAPASTGTRSPSRSR